MKPGNNKQSYRRITHSDTMHPMTARDSESRGLSRGEAGAIERGVDAYYEEHPEFKRPWKQTRGIARQVNYD